MKRVAVLLLLAFPIVALAQDQEEVPAGEGAPGVNWLSFDEAVKTGADEDKAIVIDVYAPWCGWCNRFQSEVYTDDAIEAYVNENFAITRLNLDETEQTHEFKGYTLTPSQLGNALGATGTPTTVFLASNGDYITRLPGFITADDYLNVLKFIQTKAYENVSFQEYLEQQQSDASP